MTRVPAQQLYCRVRSVPAAPSIAKMGSLCNFQNLGVSKRTSLAVRAALEAIVLDFEQNKDENDAHRRYAQ